VNTRFTGQSPGTGQRQERKGEELGSGCCRCGRSNSPGDRARWSTRIPVGKRKESGTESGAAAGCVSRAGRLPGCVTWLWTLRPSEGTRRPRTPSAGPRPSRQRRPHLNPAQLPWAAQTTPLCPRPERLWKTNTQDVAQGPRVPSWDTVSEAKGASLDRRQDKLVENRQRQHARPRRAGFRSAQHSWVALRSHCARTKPCWIGSMISTACQAASRGT